MESHIHDFDFAAAITEVKCELTEFATVMPTCNGNKSDIIIKKEESDTIGATQNFPNTGLECNDIKIKLYLSDDDDLSNTSCNNKEPVAEIQSKMLLERKICKKQFANSIDLKTREVNSDIYANNCVMTDGTLNHITEYDNGKYLCSRHFKTKKNISKHIHNEKIHDDILPKTSFNYNCQICAKSLKTKQNLSNHMKIHTGERNYKCEICMKCFTAKSSLLIHMRTHNGERNYKCETCNKCFTRKEQLTNHFKIHTGEKNYKCEICTKRFTEKSNLSAHMKIHNGERNYMCDVCTKCFIGKGDLLKHMKIHTGERNFKCEICDKCFTANGDLLKHTRIHTGEKNYRCEFCNKCFTAKSSLSIHLRIHTGERNHKCEICDKCFITRGDLLKHMRIHTGERNYKCGICTKCFTTKSNLSSHMTIHTGERSYNCEICSKCFKTKQNLLSHLKVHTGKKHVLLKFEKSHTEENNGEQPSLYNIQNVGKIERGLIKKETAVPIKKEKMNNDNDIGEMPPVTSDVVFMEKKLKSTEIVDLPQTFTSEIIIKEEHIMVTT